MGEMLALLLLIRVFLNPMFIGLDSPSADLFVFCTSATLFLCVDYYGFICLVSRAPIRGLTLLVAGLDMDEWRWRSCAWGVGARLLDLLAPIMIAEFLIFINRSRPVPVVCWALLAALFAPEYLRVGSSFSVAPVTPPLTRRILLPILRRRVFD